MTTDLCALTDQVLPRYTEGVLSPTIRQRIDDHAAECPTCRERLDRAAATLAPPPEAEARRDMPTVRPLSRRMRRTLLCLLIGISVGGAGLRYAVGQRHPSDLAAIPAHVKSSEQLAAQAIPGWNRAKTAGLVADIGITEKIAGTAANITLEKAWYSGRQVYLLYTVTAPKGEYVLPTEALLGAEGRTAPVDGGTDWHHLSQWGGFSSAGFHGVLVFPSGAAAPSFQRLKLTISQWAPVTPEAGRDQSRTAGAGLNLLLPAQVAYLRERAPEYIPWTRQQTWLGRTLTLENLQVGIGRLALTGRIDLPKGEQPLGLDARVLVGGKALDLKEFAAGPPGATGSYIFTATFDGPDQWPAPLKLELAGIAFGTAQTPEWPGATMVLNESWEWPAPQK